MTADVACCFLSLLRMLLPLVLLSLLAIPSKRHEALPFSGKTRGGDVSFVVAKKACRVS